MRIELEYNGKKACFNTVTTESTLSMVMKDEGTEVQGWDLSDKDARELLGCLHSLLGPTALKDEEPEDVEPTPGEMWEDATRVIFREEMTELFTDQARGS